MKTISAVKVIKLVGYSRSYLCQLIKEGKFPQGFLNSSGNKYFYAKDIDDWIANRKQKFYGTGIPIIKREINKSSPISTQELSKRLKSALNEHGKYTITISELKKLGFDPVLELSNGTYWEDSIVNSIIKKLNENSTNKGYVKEIKEVIEKDKYSQLDRIEKKIDVLMKAWGV